MAEEPLAFCHVAARTPHRDHKQGGTTKCRPSGVPTCSTGSQRSRGRAARGDRRTRRLGECQGVGRGQQREDANGFARRLASVERGAEAPLIKTRHGLARASPPAWPG
eukprot:scaffold3505_cov385-Prasinococcus_capsulatus_cf.AAC.5